MAETRQIRGMTIHFLGDNAAQLAKSFDGSLARSQLFRDAMDETARTQRHIYVGGSLDDLRDQPGFERTGFDTDSERRRSTSAFGHASGADSYFIVVTNQEHHLRQNNGKIFPGSTDLSLVHEFLHPSQMMRTFAESGKLETEESEARVQFREQKIAEELGWRPGIDFPDVFVSGPYGVKLDSPQVQPTPAPNGDPALPVDPMSYEGGAPPSQTQPIFLRQPDDRSAPRLVNTTATAAGIAPRDLNFTQSPPEPEGMIGLFSGKPMRFPFAPIFQTRALSDVTSNSSGRSAPDDLIWNGLRSQTFSPPAVAPPLAPDRQNSSSNGNGLAPPNSFDSTLLAAALQSADGPLSANDAYLLYLKRLNDNQSQVAAYATAPSPPLSSRTMQVFQEALLADWQLYLALVSQIPICLRHKMSLRTPSTMMIPRGDGPLRA